MQVLKILHARLALRRLGPARVRQDRGHLGVGEASMAVHHRRVELVGVHVTVGRDQHVADHAQAIHVGVERTQAVAEFFRQHRDDAARKVHAGGTVVRVHVDRAVRLDVVADIGNGHQQAPAVGLLAPAGDHGGLAIHRVVEVACVFAVDGAQRHVGQVHPARLVRRLHRVGQRARLGHGGGRELVRHAVLAHGDLDLHARIVDVAQHLTHPANGLAIQRGRLGQLDHHHFAGLGLANALLGNQHILAVALVFRRHQPDAAFVQQPPDDRVRRALHDFHHAAFGAAALVVAHHAHLDVVAVQHRAHLVRGQIDVGRTVIWRHKTVPVAVPLHHTFNFFQPDAGYVRIFDIESLLVLMPRWRNW